MNTKKRLQRFLSMFLVCMMVCSTPLNVLASSEIFVSDAFADGMAYDTEETMMADETEFQEGGFLFSDEISDASEFPTEEDNIFNGEFDLFSDGTGDTAGLFAESEAPAGDVQAADSGIANGNVIDITDKTVYERSSWKSVVNYITIEGATVVSASENGTTVDIVLDSDTDPSAALKATFAHTTKALTWSQNNYNCTLSGGSGTMQVTVSAKLGGSMSGSLTYTLNFTSLAPAGVVPERLQETDSIEKYEGQAVQLNLGEYFKYATVYYLVEGERKTELDGKVYNVPETGAGTYTYVFAASNEAGMCEELVTVTVKINQHESGGFYIGATTSNGSLDAVKFTDESGNLIEGIKVSIQGTAIRAALPKTYPLDGKVTATFSRTANDSDYPFLTSSTAASGPSSGTALGRKTDIYTTTLNAGAGSATLYFYNSKPSTTSNSYTTYTITYAIVNELPVLAQGQSASAEDTIPACTDYKVDVTPVFADADEDALTYYVSVNGSDKVLIEDPQAYVYNTNVAGAHQLVFFAHDGKGFSTETYTVNLTVEDSEETYTMKVSMPKELNPEFYVGADTTGKKLEVTETVSPETATAEYQVQYPINAENIFVSTEGWGGSAIAAAENGSVTLRQVTVKTVDFAEKEIEANVTVTYDTDKTAVCGENGYLLAIGTEYVYSAAPKDTSMYVTATETDVLEDGTDVFVMNLGLGYKSPKTITVPTGAAAQMFAYNKYYDFTEIEAVASVENEDETTTFYFVTSKNNLSWRASREGYVTETGYWENKNITVNFDNGTNSAPVNASVEDNSVMVNVNGQNNLVLSPGASYLLKGYRVWEIIKLSYQNEILTPDFNFDILSGSDVISLTPADSISNGGSGEDSDWVTVKAENAGTAILEVTYDALDVSGGNYSGLYKAADPTRTGLVVVQVGGHDDSVKFGIDCYASTGSLTYNASNARAWDAEFDTLYFTGENGNLKLSPTASSAVLEVAVSHNKGVSWSALQSEGGVYTAPVVSGNNIIRVTTENGVSYQVVRGKQVSYSVNVISGNGDDKIDAGETVRVIFDGLHTPIPKMSGNYNPGYQANTDGDSSVHMTYTMNGNAVHGAGAQYNFATAANYIDVTIPEDYTESSISLTDGYIALGVIGLKEFTNGGDSHRNIPDNGCATRGNETTFHTRSILPEMDIIVGGNVSPNTAPAVSANALKEAALKFGYNYPINPERLFTDAEGDELTYYVAVNDGEKTEVFAAYKFIPEAAGEYQLVFTASDGEFETSHTVTITVTENEDLEEELPFDIEKEDIEGYVSVGFEDYGIRVEGEKGLVYPVPLGTIVESTKVPYAEGDTIATVTLRLLDALGIEYSYSGNTDSEFYFASLQKFVVDGTYYESMSEFDAGKGSGWMITYNNWFVNKGAAVFEVSDGDLIKWQYTCQYGADIGCDADHPSAEITGLNFKKAYGMLSQEFAPEIESYVYAVPENVTSIALEAKQENYWAVATYTVNGKTYKPMAEIPVEEGTEIVIHCSYANNAGEEPVDTDTVKIVVHKAHSAAEDYEKTAEEHWNTCSYTGCKFVFNQEAHKFGDLQEAEDGSKYKECEVCKFVITETAEEAKEMVEAIPSVEEITLENKSAVEAARAAYEALSEEEKAQLPANVLKKLEEAEAKLKELHVCSWGEGEVTKAPTCTTTGIRTYTCECGETKTEVIEKNGHSYGSWKTVSRATVFKAEVQKRTCTVCGTSKQRNVGEALKAVLELPGKLKSFYLQKGNSVKFAVTMAKGDSIASVKSSKTAYLKVSGVAKKSGQITLKGVKAGTSNLTITLASGKTRTYKVQVTNGLVKTKKLTVNNVSGSKLTLAKGKTFVLEAVKAPFSSSQKITYQTSDKKIVSVSSTGELKALKAGQAVITVTSGSKKVKVTVTVPGITNVKSKVTVKANKTLTLKPKTYGLSGKVTYTSSDKNVAKVSSKGKITGVAPGKAVITVSCGGKKVKTTVTVPGIANIESAVTVKKNKTLTLKPELYGISGSATYQTSNKKIATVTSKGKIKGIKKGTAKITIKAGAFTKTVTVTVK